MMRATSWKAVAAGGDGASERKGLLEDGADLRQAVMIQMNMVGVEVGTGDARDGDDWMFGESFFQGGHGR